MKIQPYLRLAACCLMGAWLLPACAVEDPVLGSNIAGLLDYAREHNPELAASRYEADALRQRVQSASALPDPVLRTELMDITNQGTSKGTSLLPSQVGSTRYTLMQSVPWFGKRDLQREVAEAQAAQSDGQVAATWAELAGRIKAAYAMYYYYAGSERLTGETLDLMANLEQVAQTRYANGLGTQQDVIRAQVEQTGFRSELLALENERHHSQARLNSVLSRPAMAELAQPVSLRHLPAAAQLDYAVLEQKLRAHNPQLQIADARIVSAEKSRDLVYNNRYPGFTLGVADPERQCDHLLELDGRVQHPAATGCTPLRGTRVRVDAGGFRFPQGSAAQPDAVRSVGKHLRPGNRATHRIIDRDTVAAASRADLSIRPGRI
jgi:cobalt-zinc-cadmium efflux system outer membrane protein